MNKKLTLIIGITIAIVGFLIGLKIFSKTRLQLPCRSKPPAAPISAESASARELETRGDLIGARQEYLRLINEMPNSREVLLWQKKVEELNIALLFSPTITPGSIEYEIKPGDSLDKIAREHATTVELIKKSNGLASDNIFPGKK